MSIEESIAIVIFIVFEVALIYSLIMHKPQPDHKAQEELLPFDPCGSCHRWGECNGVNRPYCPLWQDHDNEEAKHGKEKRN